MKNLRNILTLFLSLIIGLHPILISAEKGVSEKAEVYQEESSGIGEEAVNGESSSEVIAKIQDVEAENGEPYAGGTIAANVSYSKVTGNASETSLPEGETSFVKGETVWFNMQATQDIKVQDVSLWLEYLHDNMASSISCLRGQYDYDESIQYESYSCKLDYGIYTYYWRINGIQLTGSIYVPKVTLSSSNISLDMFGAKDVTIDCTMNYTQDKYTLEVEKGNNCVSCSWGEWNGNIIPLTITANSVGTTTIDVLLKRVSDDKVFDIYRIPSR